MPQGNPFAPVIEVGGSAGPVQANAGISTGSLSVGDHHVAAGAVAAGLLILVILWKMKFRFSTTIG